MLHDPTLNITERTTMRELGQMLPLENHKENFVFVSRETTCAAVRQMFERISGRNKRLSVVFITEHGSKEEKLLGMVTPWDVMREE